MLEDKIGQQRKKAKKHKIMLFLDPVQYAPEGTEEWFRDNENREYVA